MTKSRLMRPLLPPLLLLLLVLVLDTQAAPQRQPPLDDPNAVYAAPITTTTTTTETTSATPFTSTTSANLKSATVPDNDQNKELLDYEESFLRTLQFFVPPAPTQTNPQISRQQTQEDYVKSLVNHYHDHDQLYAYLLELTRNYPQVTRLYEIGTSVEGRKLWALEISERPGEHEPMKPEFRYIANLHGNEAVGRELLLHLARLILDNYKMGLLEEAAASVSGDPATAAQQQQQLADTPSGPKFMMKLVRATRIHLLPSANPDGFARSHVACKYEPVGKKGRLNANKIDLNRVFPDKALGTHADAGTQPEVKALMDWSQQVPFVLSANLHGGAVVASIPYDSSLNRSLPVGQADERRSPDHETYVQLAQAYSLYHPTMHKGEMCYDKCTDYHPEVFPGGITTGSGWYHFYGSLQDWAYDHTNDFHVTLEIGCNQYPPAEALEQYWAYNKAPLLNFMRQVHRGIKGQVRDAASGRLLAGVNVHVRHIDHNVTTTRAGDYFRLLAPGGPYEVLFEHAHYEPARLASVWLEGTMAQVYNIQLRPRASDGNADSTMIHDDEHEQPQPSPSVEQPADDQRALVVATLVMSVVTLVLLLLLAGAYVIQKRRFSRSQSVSVELQPTSRHHATSSTTTTTTTSDLVGRSQSAGISLPPLALSKSAPGPTSGSSLSQHI